MVRRDALPNRAYELVTLDGSREARLSLNDFPNEKVDPAALPEIELEIVVYGNEPGEEWIETRDGEKFVREKFVWEEPDQAPVRSGFNVRENRWAAKTDDERVPWGAANVAKAGRPMAHRINAFGNPDDQAKQVLDLLSLAINKRIQNLGGSEDDERTQKFNELRTQLVALKQAIVADARPELEQLEADHQAQATRFAACECRWCAETVPSGDDRWRASSFKRDCRGAALAHIGDQGRPKARDAGPAAVAYAWIDDSRGTRH